MYQYVARDALISVAHNHLVFFGQRVGTGASPRAPFFVYVTLIVCAAVLQSRPECQAMIDDVLTSVLPVAAMAESTAASAAARLGAEATAAAAAASVDAVGECRFMIVAAIPCRKRPFQSQTARRGAPL